MDVVATKDPRFGNEDLDCGNESEELPHLGLKSSLSYLWIRLKGNKEFEWCSSVGS